MSEGLMNFKKCDEFVAEFEKVIEKPVKRFQSLLCRYRFRHCLRGYGGSR